MTPNEYLRSKPLNGGVLYYPGAGTDIGPFSLFADAAGVTTVVCADYKTTRIDAEAFITQLAGKAPIQIQGMSPHDFGVETWDAFWPDDPASRGFANPSGAFAVQAWLPTMPGEPPIRFIYLATEAIQTFAILVRAGITPTAVVLQDHGCGGNWDRFGRDGQLWETARRLNALPEHVLVAENTDAWAGYKQVTDYALCGGQIHEHNRALFRRLRNA